MKFRNKTVTNVTEHEYVFEENVPAYTLTFDDETIMQFTKRFDLVTSTNHWSRTIQRLSEAELVELHAVLDNGPKEVKC